MMNAGPAVARCRAELFGANTTTRRNPAGAVALQVALAVVGTVAGCTPRPSFVSRANLEESAPVERLLVIASLRGPIFDDDDDDDDSDQENLTRGFAVGLTSRLTSCGVRSKVLFEDPLEFHPETRIAESLRALQASAILSINTIGGTRTIGTTPSVGGLGGRRQRPNSTLAIEFKLADAVSNRSFWLARSKLVLKSEDLGDPAVGVDFATDLVAKLRSDGILNGCPPPGTDWPPISVRHHDADDPAPGPDCAARRQEILLQATAIEDKGKRTRKIQSAPRCD